MPRNLDLYTCISSSAVCLDRRPSLILKAKYKYFKSNLFLYSCSITLPGGVDEATKLSPIPTYFLCHTQPQNLVPTLQTMAAASAKVRVRLIQATGH